MKNVAGLLDSLLGDLPVASTTFVAGAVLLIIAYCNGTVGFDEAWKDLLFLGGASGGIGYVRNQAGKGVK